MDCTRIRGRWYAVILLMVPGLTGLGVAGDMALGGRGADLAAAARLVEHPSAVLPFVVFVLLFGPVPEELAWREYALEQLQQRWNALVSSVVLGGLWTVWHVPLFFLTGTYQQRLGVGTPGFWLFMLDKVPQSILMTWIYNNTHRSTLSAVLVHFMVNCVGELCRLTPRAAWFSLGWWGIAAVLVTSLWGPQRLRRGGAE